MGAMPERDALVATKFHTPPPGFLPRPQLLARLAQDIGRGLTVVSTPAGFGKTTLLGAWARRSRVPTAWLSLDDGDNDRPGSGDMLPRRLISYDLAYSSWSIRCSAARSRRSRP